MAIEEDDNLGEGGVDKEVSAGFFIVTRGIRITKVRSYYEEDRNMHEIAIHTIIFNTEDPLLYCVMGDGEDYDGPGSLKELLHRKDGLIPKVCSKLADLLEDFHAEAGPFRSPWLILDVIEAPMDDEASCYFFDLIRIGFLQGKPVFVFYR